MRFFFKDISENDIVQHNNWYTKYITLKSKQEQALRFWKINKRENEKSARKKTRDNVKLKNTSKSDEKRKLKIQKWKVMSSNFDLTSYKMLIIVAFD